MLIDGKKPSEFNGCYYAARSEPGPWSPLFITRIDHTKPLLLETWTYKVTSVASDGKSWHFDLNGSVSGPDGSGVSSEEFTSRSGRVRLEPDTYFRGFYHALPAGFESKWEVLPLFVDRYHATVNQTSSDRATTVVQGLSNGPHVLELIPGDGRQELPVSAVRIYKPPYSQTANP